MSATCVCARAAVYGNVRCWHRLRRLRVLDNICLSVCLSVGLTGVPCDNGSTDQDDVCLSFCLSVCLSVCWSHWCTLRQRLDRSRWPVSVCLSVCLSVCVSVCLSVGHTGVPCDNGWTDQDGACLSVCLSVCLLVTLVCLATTDGHIKMACVCLSVCLSLCLLVTLVCLATTAGMCLYVFLCRATAAGRISGTACVRLCVLVRCLWQCR